MKIQLRILLSAILVAPLLLMSNALALEGESSTGTSNAGTSSNQTEVAQTTTDDTQKPSSDDTAGLQQRLDKRKADFKIALTNLEKQRIQLKCKASQGSLSSLKGRITGIDTSRANVYRELVDRLNKLNDKLKTRNVDTTELQGEITTLQTKITTFKTDLAAYKQAVSDLAAMDCKSDPTAFKASLEAARAARTKVNNDSLDIKKYVNETIKPTLKKLRDQVEKKESEGNQ